MPIDAYLKNVSYSIKNYNMEKLKMATHLVLDDTANSPGWTPWCGEKCTKHQFTVKTDTAQKVIVKAVTWEGRGLPKPC